MVKKLGAIAQVEDIRPHRFRHEFGTSITRKGLDPLYGKELMGIKSDKVYRTLYPRGAETSCGIALTCRQLGRIVKKISFVG